jgi:hypothetical protein
VLERGTNRANGESELFARAESAAVGAFSSPVAASVTGSTGADEPESDAHALESEACAGDGTSGSLPGESDSAWRSGSKTALPARTRALLEV